MKRASLTSLYGIKIMRLCEKSFSVEKNGALKNIHSFTFLQNARSRPKQSTPLAAPDKIEQHTRRAAHVPRINNIYFTACVIILRIFGCRLWKMGPPIVSDFVFNLFCLRSRKLLNSALTDLVKIDCMDNVKPSVSKNI